MHSPKRRPLVRFRGWAALGLRPARTGPASLLGALPVRLDTTAVACTIMAMADSGLAHLDTRMTPRGRYDFLIGNETG